MRKKIKNEETKLNPCRFCGGEAEIILTHKFTTGVKCKKCGIRISAGNVHTEKEASQLWNSILRVRKI